MPEVTAVKTRNTKRRSKLAVKNTPMMVKIDYPAREELIASPTYSYRVETAPNAVKVEISVNGSDWQSCRESIGYWWFDWHGYSAGAYTLMARAEFNNGELESSPPRRFRVEF